MTDDSFAEVDRSVQTCLEELGRFLEGKGPLSIATLDLELTASAWTCCT